LLPKFVPEGAAMYRELRRRGTSRWPAWGLYGRGTAWQDLVTTLVSDMGLCAGDWEGDEEETPQLRGRSFAEISCCH
jgi:hypothetical protein